MSNVLEHASDAPRKTSSRGRSFYLEVLLLLAGFAFVSVVIFQVVIAAYALSQNATATESAVIEARNAAEIFTASSSDSAFENALASATGVSDLFVKGDVVSYTAASGNRVTMTLGANAASAGTMRTADIVVVKSAVQADTLYSLSTSVYESGKGATS